MQKKYLEAGEIVSSIDYQTGGRPAILYSLKSAAL